MKNTLLFLYLLFSTLVVFSQNNSDSIPSSKTSVSKDSLAFVRPNLLRTLSSSPKNIYGIFKSPFHGKNWIHFSEISAGTALLILQDQPITDWVKKSSVKMGLVPDTKYKNILQFGKTRIIKIPQNLNSALYQLGEGGTSMVVAGGLFIYGKINKDWRAEQTAYDLTETFVTMGITTQIIKRISGRESPFKATQPGGRWNPFPSINQYQNNTSSLDAFPSGHLATMMATVTVLRKNYPEKKWLTPVGYSLIGLTGWAMVNTEVHWLSDYPFALAIGYISGKLTTLQHLKINNKSNKNSEFKYLIF